MNRPFKRINTKVSQEPEFYWVFMMQKRKIMLQTKQRQNREEKTEGGKARVRGNIENVHEVRKTLQRIKMKDWGENNHGRYSITIKTGAKTLISGKRKHDVVDINNKTLHLQIIPQVQSTTKIMVSYWIYLLG